MRVMLCERMHECHEESYLRSNAFNPASTSINTAFITTSVFFTLPPPLLLLLPLALPLLPRTNKLFTSLRSIRWSIRDDEDDAPPPLVPSDPPPGLPEEEEEEEDFPPP